MLREFDKRSNYFSLVIILLILKTLSLGSLRSKHFRLLLNRTETLAMQANLFFFYLFIYNNFICNNQYKKAAIREKLNPHVR